MNGSKPWYASKLVWIGVMQFVYASADLVAAFIEQADYSPTSIAALITGVLTIVFRIWFTDKEIDKGK